ncbi:MAG: autotransporter-associated beta strand repeat-containing protein, partial [Anaerolineae bacterium]|nr:autotransporter-associated beta strand repeat-containing protein [Anaerolineae bacterium]
LSNTTSALTLGTTAYSITTGGTLIVNGPTSGAMTQAFASVTVNPGNNFIIASNNGGSIFVNLGTNIVRAQGGGNLDLRLPAAGAFLTALSNNYGGLLGATGGIGANVLVTIDGTDWAMATNFGAGSLTNNIVRYAGYTDVGSGGVIADNSNSNVRITDGGADITLGSALTMIHTLAATNAGAATINFGGQTLRLGTNGAILLAPTSGGLTLGAAVGDGILTAGGTSNGAAGELIFINNSPNPLTVNATIAKNFDLLAHVMVTVNGSGLVNFAGNILNTNSFFVNGGTVNLLNTNLIFGLNVRGGVVNLAPGSTNQFFGTSVVDGGGRLNINGLWSSTSNLQVGVSAGSRAVATIGTNMLFEKIQTGLQIGDAGSAAGAVYQTGGIVNIALTTGSADATFRVGNGAGAYGYYMLSGGLMTMTGRVNLGLSGAAVFEVFGGTFTNSEYFMIGRNNGASAVVNVFGGSVLSGNTQPVAMNWDNPGFGMLNVGGAGLFNAAMANNQALWLNRQVGGTGVLNLLSGGTVIANQVTANAAGQTLLNFDGGTLIARPGTTLGGAFIPSNLLAAVIYDGGAIIDSDTNYIVVPMQLTGPVGYGVTNIAVNYGGIGYIGAPIVQIVGGSGTGATAIAQIDLDPGSPTYQRLTNILITSTGSGYLANDALTVQLLGGGPIQPAELGAFSFGSNVNTGGLTKNGLGALTLLQTNTYGGATIVNAGSLVLGSTNSIGPAALILASPTASIGQTNFVDQAFLNWASARIGAPIPAIVIATNQAGNLSFAGDPNLTNAFLGSAVGAGAIFTGTVAWADTALRLGGGAGLLIYQPNIAGATNLLVGPAGGNPLNIVRLGGTNTFTGGILVQSGTLWASNDFNLGASGNSITLTNGGGLRTSFSGPMDNRAITLQAGGGVLNQDAATALYVTNLISGPGSLTKIGAGTLLLFGNNTYSGGTFLTGGTLSIESAANIGGGTPVLSFSGGVLQ